LEPNEEIGALFMYESLKVVIDSDIYFAVHLNILSFLDAPKRRRRAISKIRSQGRIKYATYTQPQIWGILALFLGFGKANYLAIPTICPN